MFVVFVVFVGVEKGVSHDEGLLPGDDAVRNSQHSRIESLIEINWIKYPVI